VCQFSAQKVKRQADGCIICRRWADTFYQLLFKVFSYYYYYTDLLYRGLLTAFGDDNSLCAHTQTDRQTPTNAISCSHLASNTVAHQWRRGLVASGAGGGKMANFLPYVLACGKKFFSEIQNTGLKIPHFGGISEHL